mgnify:CR=1 FL=1
MKELESPWLQRIENLVTIRENEMVIGRTEKNGGKKWFIFKTNLYTEIKVEEIVLR